MTDAFICYGCGQKIIQDHAIEIDDGFKKYFHTACASSLGIKGRQIFIGPIFTASYLASIILDKMSQLLIENNSGYMEIHLCVMRKMTSEQIGSNLSIGDTYSIIRKYFPEIHFGNSPTGKFIKVDLKTINKYTK